MQALRARSGADIPVAEDQLAGSLLGQALGDALGFVVEAEPPEVARSYVEDWLRAGRGGERSHPHFPFGQYTDDTQFARELLLSFEERAGWDPAAFAGRLAALFREGRDVGAGWGTRSAALRLASGMHWSRAATPSPYAGNGSAMRAGQIGLLFPDERDTVRVAGEQSRITHLDRRCAAGAVAVARAVALAGARQPLDSGPFLEEIAASAQQEDTSVGAAIRGLIHWASLESGAAAQHVHGSGLDAGHSSWHGISAFVIPSVCWSLYAFLRSPDDYWETICTAIAVGGDTDTMAAIAGAISGARLGLEALPAKYLSRLTDRGSWGAEALTRLARSCASIANRSGLRG
jgi:ADP-ribosylglycohydrolase